MSTDVLMPALSPTMTEGSVSRWLKKEGDEIHAGDVIWFPPGEKHWHGAAPTTAMVHIAMQEAQDGKHVEWMEQVTQAQYTAAAAR